jgi:adenine phosphoribosyltransferase
MREALSHGCRRGTQDGSVITGAAQTDLRARLREAFCWLGDRPDRHQRADVTGWWRAPDLLADLGPALAQPFTQHRPTVVLGLQSRGCLLGPLVAVTRDVGFVEVGKDPTPSSDSDAWLIQTTPPGYRDRQLRLGLTARPLHPTDRVLLVDDWIDTGGQASGAHLLVHRAGAHWLGVTVIVDALHDHQTRRRLNVTTLLHLRDL